MKMHIANQGETWELLSWKFYGASRHADVLIWANFGLRNIAVFSGGEQLWIPDLPEETKKAANLPPWRV